MKKASRSTRFVGVAVVTTPALLNPKSSTRLQSCSSEKSAEPLPEASRVRAAIAGCVWVVVAGGEEDGKSGAVVGVAGGELKGCEGQSSRVFFKTKTAMS